jgi:restriction system protein
VSRSPFAPPSVATAAAATNAAFSADLLAKLEWKRFEELVAAYYNKTGVVATRTKSGPMSPVHIKISWKGEQRPFACVQCHAHPPGLLDAKPVQSLVDALAAEDIRRGYVVTSGKFGVPARDLAEEKHITLLSGDLFLDKLNALPEPARAELLREATSGDYSTPSCPTCESKMTRAIGESAWSCPQCGTTLARG